MRVKKFEFGNEFRKWIPILFKNLELCVIIDGKTTPLESGTRQADPIFGIAALYYSFGSSFPVMEVNHTFLHSAYADDDSTFRLRSKKSAIEVIKTLDFLFFSGLKKPIMQRVKLLALMSKKSLRWHSVEINVSI